MTLTCDIKGVEFAPLEIISHDVNDPVTPQSALKHYR